MRIGIIGYGNMGSAFARVLLNSPNAESITVYDIDETRKERALKDGFATAQDLYFLIKNSDILLIAVKPKDVDKLLKDIKGSITGDKIVMTIVAGLELSFYEEILGKGIKLVRLMPNVGVLVGKGSIAFTHNGRLSQEEVETSLDLLSVCGKLYEIPESLFDSFTALAGSGPAFVMEFIDAMAMGGVKEGFSYEQALQIAIDTVLSSAYLLREKGGNPNEWITKVTSPGGTTVEGIAYLERKGFRGTVIRCIEKTSEKARKLKG